MWIVTFIVGLLLGYALRIVDVHMRDCGTQLVIRTIVLLVVSVLGLILSVTFMNIWWAR